MVFPYPFRLFWIDFCLFLYLIQKKQLYDDHSSLILRITAPKDQLQYTDRFMQEISKLVDDSIPAKVSLVVHLAWIFFRSSGFVRLTKRTW
jgi:HAE1 family hydrophobic/amphiphilic exporter-1/multidrug efflux pump